jgi:hypothetical protein
MSVYVKRPWLAVVGVALLLWAGVDLYVPRSTNIRQFDPAEVGRIETDMWRSYYDRKPFQLFLQLAELMRLQYHFPLLRSNVVAYHAAKAAFVFKDGHNRTDYEKALPYLVDFYTAVREVSGAPFDVDRAARLELEWWIIHRERKSHPRGDLDRSLAELPAEIYRLPARRFMEHARLRAEAMLLRDARADAGGVSEADWARIEELLKASWQSLWKTANS